MEIAIKNRIGQITGRFERLFEALSRHEIFLLSASLAYNLAVALAPFVVVALFISNAFGPEFQARIVEEAFSLLGPQGGSVVETIVQSAQENPLSGGVQGIVSLLVIVIAASSIFGQLRYGMDKINETPADERPWSIKRLLVERLALSGLVIGTIFLMLSSLILSAFLSGFLKGLVAGAWGFLSFAVTLMSFTVLFSASFRFVPTEDFDWKRCFVSGVVAAIFFSLGKELIGLYLGRVAVGSSYGAAGSMVALLVWLYYTSFTFNLSHEFTNKVIFQDE